jgi:hypothetical protein
MALRVAFDLDGTVADMFGVLQVEAMKLFGPSAAVAEVEAVAAGDRSERRATEPATSLSRLELNSRQRARLWKHVECIKDFWTTLPETEPGIVRRIATIAVERRWEVIFLTTRPEVAGETTQRQSQRWLEAHGFEWPSVFVVRRSRGRVAEAFELDAVVDDRPENCLDVALESKAQAILVQTGVDQPALPGAKRLGVRVVPSISAALALLQKLDTVQGGPGVARRMRRLFKG